MNDSTRPADAGSIAAMRSRVRADWRWIGAIAAVAIIARLAFFSGGRGSDEVMYLTQALKLLSGDWGHSTYIGEIRYGITFALALSIRVFGHGAPGAAGVIFLCSIGEVVLAFWFANRLWGRQAAIWSGLALATLPMGVYLPGSMLPDPYLGFVIELSIVTFYFAQRDNDGRLFFLAGLLAAWVFWIKEAVAVYGLIFVFEALAQRRFPSGWRWFLLGGAIGIAANCAFFWVLFGDPFYVLNVLRKRVADAFIATEIADTSLWTYFLYLFQKIYDTGLIGWLALAGALQMLWRRRDAGTRFVLIWGLGLLLIFSAFPISLSPLKFIAKQENYMTYFLAPLALIAGWFIAQQPRKLALVIGGAMVLSGIVFSARQQYHWRSITLNGELAAAFAEAHPDTLVVGPFEEVKQSMLARLLRGSLDTTRDIKRVSELVRRDLSGGADADRVAYFVDDPPNWGFIIAEEHDRLLATKLTDCAVPVGRLQSTDLGLGRPIAAFVDWVLSPLPVRISDQLGFGALQPFANPMPATVYTVSRACALSLRIAAKE